MGKPPKEREGDGVSLLAEKQSTKTKGGARPGSGRPLGVPNKVTADVRALAQVHGPAAIQELARLASEAESEGAKVAAIKELLDRAYGKSTQSVDISAEVTATITAIKRIIVDPRA